MRQTIREAGQAFRRLRAAPVDALVGSLALGVGIGGATLVFTVIAALLLAPLPYREPERLLVLTPKLGDWQFFERCRRDSRLLREMAAYVERAGNLSDTQGADRILLGRVSDRFFAVTGVRPVLGRVFHDSDFTPGHDDVALLTDAMWRRRYSARTDVVGTSIDLDDRVYQIVGVLAQDFRAPTDLKAGRTLSIQFGAEILLPLSGDPRVRDPLSSDTLWRGIDVLMRIPSGASVEAARGEVRALARQWFRLQEPPAYDLVRLRDYVAGDLPKQLAMLTAAVGLLLCVSCANVANLVLARALARSRELATRIALGAPRAVLLRFTILEAAWFAVAGAVVGVVMAWVGSWCIVALGGATLSRLADMTVNWKAVLWAVLVSAVVALAVGVLPGVAIWRTEPNRVLRGDEHYGVKGRTRLRVILVATEVALSLVLVLEGALLAQDLGRLMKVDLGFRPDGIETADVALSRKSYSDRSTATNFYDRVIARARQEVGSTAVALTSSVPGGPAVMVLNVHVPNARTFTDHELRSGGEPAEVFERYELVSGDYFSLLSIRLVAGRRFDDRDSMTSERVAIVNEAFAEKYWGQSTFALDQPMTFGLAGFRVVGVVGNVRGAAPSDRVVPLAYFPYSQFPTPPPQMTLLFRRPTGGARISLSHVVRELSPTQPVAKVIDMGDLVWAPLMRRRLIVTMLSVFAIATLIVGGSGVYASLACGTRERVREWAVRIALGATPARVAAVAVKEAVRVVSLGVGTGLMVAVWVAWLLRSFLVDVSYLDVSTYVVVSGSFFILGLGAGFVPAISAIRTDVCTLLRSE